MVRECAFAYITRAGAEIGVASTKAFTTQLVGLFLLTLALAQVRGRRRTNREAQHLKALRHLPVARAGGAGAGAAGGRLGEAFARKENALFLGRGLHYPIALEGAPEAQGDQLHPRRGLPGRRALKHGPLALVTSAMPVVTVAPNDALVDKLKSNMQEVRAAAASCSFADADTHIESGEGVHVIRMPEHYADRPVRRLQSRLDA